ncbi:DUF977 family protein [Citrobacter freundii]|uniref:DUF977 family protein n=1 Tax=Citrobacter freundii TaxID=546 RepID=UPI0015E9B23F|nr:DUF977 family protein [Citrobacter freundii]QLR77979.1 DUF977 family protein [Citrobacter freundii]
MPRPNTPDEQAALIRVIIEEVKIRGRLTVSGAALMLSLHRQTAGKYFRVAAKRGELIHYGRLSLFRDQKTAIDFDLQRFSYGSSKPVIQLPGDFRGSVVMRRVMDIVGRMQIKKDHSSSE